MEKIGSDLDGVIAFNELPRKDYRPHRMREWYKACIKSEFKIPKELIIVTGRKEVYRKLTKQWLKENEIEYIQLIMMSNGIKKNKSNLIEFKMQVINELKIDLFYEDDKDIVKALKESCKKTKIVGVGLNGSKDRNEKNTA